jgi:hypothetical protein
LLADAGELAMTDIKVTYPGHEHSIQAASGTIPDFHALRRLAFQLAPTSSKLFKLWSYRLTPAYAAVPLPVNFSLVDSTQEIIQSGELAEDSGQVMLSLDGKIDPATLLVDSKT